MAFDTRSPIFWLSCSVLRMSPQQHKMKRLALARLRTMLNKRAAALLDGWITEAKQLAWSKAKMQAARRPSKVKGTPAIHTAGKISKWENQQ